MKTIKQFIIWLFYDLAFYIYELAEIRFTLQGAPIFPTKKNKRRTAPPILPYVYIPISTYRSIIGLGAMIKTISFSGINYIFDGVTTDGNYVKFSLPNLVTKAPSDLLATQIKTTFTTTEQQHSPQIFMTTTVKGSKSNSDN